MRSIVTENLRSKSNIAVWGLGGLGKAALKYWLPKGKIKLGFDAHAKEKFYIEGVKCIPPSREALVGINVVVITSTAYAQIIAALDSLGFSGEKIYIYELFCKSDISEVGELEALKIDLLATKGSSAVKLLLDKPQVLVNITFRLGRWSHNSWPRLPLYYLFYVLHALVCVIFSIQLPLNTKIGPGLIFAHYGTIVFTSRAKIGSFFTVYHGCTVGTNDTGEGPVIGNFVTQFAGSHILGRCKIGDYTRVGANSVVLNLTCNQNSTVVGCPARTIER